MVSTEAPASGTSCTLCVLAQHTRGGVRSSEGTLGQRGSVGWHASYGHVSCAYVYWIVMRLRMNSLPASGCTKKRGPAPAGPGISALLVADLRASGLSLSFGLSPESRPQPGRLRNHQQAPATSQPPAKVEPTSVIPPSQPTNSSSTTTKANSPNHPGPACPPPIRHCRLQSHLHCRPHFRMSSST